MAFTYAPPRIRGVPQVPPTPKTLGSAACVLACDHGHHACSVVTFPVSIPLGARAFQSSSKSKYEAMARLPQR